MTSQNVRYQFSNHLGSASLELDETGALITYEEYYPYGSTSFQMGPDAATVSKKRYRYTGKERDEGTGFYYYGARYYIPWLARWAAVDSLEAKYAPESTYCYAHNNPVRFTDPTGMGAEVTGARPFTSSDTNRRAEDADKPGQMIDVQKYADVNVTLYLYTSERIDIDANIDKIKTELDHQYNNYDEATHSYKYFAVATGSDNNEKAQLRFHFDVKNAVTPEGARRILNGLSERAMARSNFVFLTNRQPGGNTFGHNSEAVMSVTDNPGNPNHYAHEMAHLMGYFNLLAKFDHAAVDPLKIDTRTFGNITDSGSHAEQRYHKSLYSVTGLRHLGNTHTDLSTGATGVPDTANRHVIGDDLNSMNSGGGILTKRRNVLGVPAAGSGGVFDARYKPQIFNNWAEAWAFHELNP